MTGDSEMRGSSERRHEGFEAWPPFAEGQGSQILAVLHQQVVGPHMDRVAGDGLGRHGLAIEALLQAGEGLDPPLGDDQQLAVERRVAEAAAGEAVHQVRECAGNIVPAARIQPGRRPAVRIEAGHGLHPDAVPLPFGREFSRR